MEGVRAPLVPLLLVLPVLVAACGSREPARPPPPLPPIPVIADAPPDALTCSALLKEASAAARSLDARTLHARLAFAGCYAPACPPCPRNVTCSPCEQGYCTLVGDTPAEASCALRTNGTSAECAQMLPGVVYVMQLETLGAGAPLSVKACWELAGAPRVDLDAAGAARRAALDAEAGRTDPSPPAASRTH
jgi:hypothetical protein